MLVREGRTALAAAFSSCRRARLIWPVAEQDIFAH